MADKISKNLLDWYELNGRTLPWRVRGGAHPDPYVILVSEIMLQQTTVKTVIPYFHRFMQRFPTVKALAAAPLEEVYFYWQGLGYYTRARSLHASARMIVNEYDGRFPCDKQTVAKLKGLGSYTIASFLALAFNLPETVVDGNVIRIICRMFRLRGPAAAIMPEIRQRAEELADKQHPADYASAVMDLGALVCTPKNPRCRECPWQSFCLSGGKDDVENFPERRKADKKEIHGFVYIIRSADGSVLIRRRTEKGLLSGLYEFPWSETPLFDDAETSGLSVTHIFTHIRLTLELCFIKSDEAFNGGSFVKPADLSRYPFSTLMKKVWKKARF